MTSLSESASHSSSLAERTEPGSIEILPPRLEGDRIMGMPRRRHGRGAQVFLAVADIVGLVGAFLLSQYFLSQAGLSPPIGAGLLLVVVPAWITGAKFCGLYDRDAERLAHSTPDDIVRVFLLTTVCFFLITNVAAFTGAIAVVGDAGDTSLTVCVFWGFAVVLILVSRSAGRAVARRRQADLQPTAVIGAGPVGQVIARRLMQHPPHPIRLVGVVDERARDQLPAGDSVASSISTPLGEVPVLGTLDEIYMLIGQLDLRRAIFAVPNDEHGRLADSVRTLRASGVHVDIVPVLASVVGPTCNVHSVEGISVLGLAPISLSRPSQFIKRAVDVVVALVGLLVAAPALLIIGAAVKMTSPGPVLFRQTRLGKHMSPFTVLKFRTMNVDADESVHEGFIAATMRGELPPAEGGLFKLSREADVTPIGRWLRRTSLDELPQLINVLRGEMSLVGPRPCIPYEVKEFEPHHFDRFLVPAGITCYWQTSARARATYSEALDLDALYAQNWSLGLDLLILARTPPELLSTRATQ
jgi:exopolysaccharide biosynthesis polyprenyl glycosylphosphotransferase